MFVKNSEMVINPMTFRKKVSGDWNEVCSNPKMGPPFACNHRFVIRRVKDQINPPSRPILGSYILNDDDWAIAPNSHTQSQKLPTMNYGFEGVSNAKEYTRDCPRLGDVNPGWQ